MEAILDCVDNRHDDIDVVGLCVLGGVRTVEKSVCDRYSRRLPLKS